MSDVGACDSPSVATGDRSATRLYDVDNIEAFVNASIARTNLRMDADERDELLAEGVLILYGLADRYEHHRPGYSRPGSFAGYAASILPSRLIDAWHKHRQHRYVTGPTGQREWDQGPRAMSLDELHEGGGDVAAATRDSEPEIEAFEERLRRALRDEFEARIALCSQVAVMRADGMGPREIASDLGVPETEVRDADGWLGRALERLT